MSVSVPIKLLQKSEGYIVTWETFDGEIYRGQLIEAEDNMNCQVTDVRVQYPNGRVARMDNVYVRASKVRFIRLPEIMLNASLLQSKWIRGGFTTVRRGRGGPPMDRGEPPMGGADPSAAGSWN